MPTKTNRRNLLKGASLLALPAVPARPAAPAPASPAPASKYTWPVRPLMVADLRHSLDAKVQAKRVEEFLVIDDMESERGWRASAALELSYTEERAKAGRRSLRPGTRWHEDPRGSVAHAGQGRPWVVVAVPEGRVAEAVEAFGTAAPLARLGDRT